MLHHSRLDAVFAALADPTRRAMVERLSAGPASVSELAAPFPVSLSAIGQHLQLLEACGLVRSQKVGRVRTVELEAETLRAADAWFAQHLALWHRRLDQLGALLDEEAAAAPPMTPTPPTTTTPTTTTPFSPRDEDEGPRPRRTTCSQTWE
jgi:DNA-binding transcriptional ArsR family regulator